MAPPILPIDRPLAAAAVAMALPLIVAAMADPACGDSGFLHIVVLDPALPVPAALAVGAVAADVAQVAAAIAQAATHVNALHAIQAAHAVQAVRAAPAGRAPPAADPDHAAAGDGSATSAAAPADPFEAAILYEHSLGDRALWDADYAAFARAKARLSWQTGLDSYTVHQRLQRVLTGPDAPLWGSVARDGLIVGVSGAYPWFDEVVAGVVACCLQGLAKARLLDFPRVRGVAAPAWRPDGR